MREILPTLNAEQYTKQHYVMADKSTFSEVVSFRNGRPPDYGKRAKGLQPIGAVQVGPAHWRLYF